MALKILFDGGMKFSAEGRGHRVVIDLPAPKSTDEGLTPPETFISALGSCIGVYVVSFCNKNNISCEGLAIDLDWEVSVNPTRISHINAKINMDTTALSDKDKVKLLNTAKSCLIHNTIKHNPEINIEL